MTIDQLLNRKNEIEAYAKGFGDCINWLLSEETKNKPKQEGANGTDANAGTPEVAQ